MHYEQNQMCIPVCKVSNISGYEIEYMPELLRDVDFDNHSPHVHAFYEILWFRDGTGRHTVDFQDYEVKPNTIFFFSPGQIHHFDHHTYTGVSIKICTDYMKGEDCECASYLRYNVFHNFDATPCYQIDDETAVRLDALVHEMERECALKNEFGNTDMLQALVRMFLIQVYRHGVKTGELRLDLLKPSHQLFVRFRSLVEKRFLDMHEVQDYARELHVAVRTLNKSVNDCVGMSPLTFIRGRIILEAKRLLRYSNLRIKEVSFTLGYEDPSYFVRTFKHHTGMMPSEFRETN